jgi:hypothetical protein
MNLDIIYKELMDIMKPEEQKYFSDDGGKSIIESLKPWQSTPKKIEVRADVEDLGFDPDKLVKSFNQFWQEKQSYIHKFDSDFGAPIFGELPGETKYLPGGEEIQEKMNSQVSGAQKIQMIDALEMFFRDKKDGDDVPEYSLFMVLDRLPKQVSHLLKTEEIWFVQSRIADRIGRESHDLESMEHVERYIEKMNGLPETILNAEGHKKVAAYIAESLISIFGTEIGSLHTTWEGMEAKLNNLSKSHIFGEDPKLVEETLKYANERTIFSTYLSNGLCDVLKERMKNISDIEELETGTEDVRKMFTTLEAKGFSEEYMDRIKTTYGLSLSRKLEEIYKEGQTQGNIRQLRVGIWNFCHLNIDQVNRYFFSEIMSSMYLQIPRTEEDLFDQFAQSCLGDEEKKISGRKYLSDALSVYKDRQNGSEWLYKKEISQAEVALAILD